MEEIITIELDACDHTSLLNFPTPENVWLRCVTLDNPYSGWPLVEVQGPTSAVEAFIEDHWGEGTFDAYKALARPA
jgi:hypothetical protein